MRIATLLAACGFALLAFGWWGMYTDGGRRKYDEMDGIIPFFGLVAGAVFVVAATVVWWWRGRGA